MKISGLVITIKYLDGSWWLKPTKVTLVCITVGVPVSSAIDPTLTLRNFSYETHNLVANPWTSLARSELPLDPATVENRTNMGVCFPGALRNDAAVILLQSPFAVKVPYAPAPRAWTARSGTYGTKRSSQESALSHCFYYTKHPPL